MRICEDGHDEIVYDSKYCPFCIALETIKDLEKQIKDIQDKLYNIDMK